MNALKYLENVAKLDNLRLQRINRHRSELPGPSILFPLLLVPRLYTGNEFLMVGDFLLSLCICHTIVSLCFANTSTFLNPALWSAKSFEVLDEQLTPL